MSHELEQHENADGTVLTSFVAAREDGWHRLGTVTPDCFDAKTALDKAHLANWNVRKEPVVTASGLIIPSTYATIRDNPFVPGQVDVLTTNGQTVGDQYTPIQNEGHVEFLDSLVDQSGAHFETAGSLHDGRDVFVTMELPEHMSIGGEGGDQIKTYIAALNNHSGIAAFRLLITPVRIVCANTQAAAIRGAKRSFSIRHTVNASQNIQEAREALGLTFKYLEGFQNEANMLIDQSYTDAEFEKLMTQLVGEVTEDTSKRSATRLADVRHDLMWSYTQSPTNAAIRGTKWGAYQAVTEWADYLYPVRGGNLDEKRALRVLEGRNDDVKTKAWDLLVNA